MTSSNVPPSVAYTNELTNALRQNVDAVKMLERGLGTLRMGLTKQFDPIRNLQSTFQRSEQLQLQALAAGTTYNQFLRANTEAIKGLMTSQQTMTKFLLTGFTGGLRDVQNETLQLADEMEATGQDSAVLARSFGSLRLLTGNSVTATSNLAETLRVTNRESGVTATQLIEALNSLRGVLFDASLYGQNAVVGLAELGVTLKGGLAGAAGADKAINSLLGMQNSLNVAQQEQLGLRGFFEDIRNNGFNADRHLSMIVEANDRLQSMMGDDAMTREAIARAFGGEQVRSLQMVAEGITNFQGTSEEMKISGEAFQNSMKMFEERKKKFFETYAPEMHMVITRILPLLAGGQAVGQVARAASIGIRAGRKAAAAAATAAMNPATGTVARAGLGTVARAFGGRLLASLAGGPGGLAIGLALSVPTIIDLFKGIKNNSDVQAEAAKKELDDKRRATASDLSNIQTLVGMAKGMASTLGPERMGTGSELVSFLKTQQMALTDLRVMLGNVGATMEDLQSFLKNQTD